MPRPTKWRKVCCLPKHKKFGPLDKENSATWVYMTVDEYETIRLIDLQGYTQEECAKQMNIARTTVQRMYMEARKKLAESLIHGKLLSIQGGEYKLCQDTHPACGCGKSCLRYPPQKKLKISQKKFGAKEEIS